MPKKSKKGVKKTKNIPLKAGAKATHTDKGAKFVTNVIAQGTGTGGPGSRGGKQFGGKGYKTRAKAPDSIVRGIADQLRSQEQDKIARKRYKGGGSLSYAFKSNEGMTGSEKVARRENLDTFAQMVKTGIRDGLVKAEQQRKQKEAQEKAFKELMKRDEERSKNIPEKAITNTPSGVRVDTGKLVPFVKAGRLAPQTRILDEGQKFKVIERRQDQLRKIVSIPENPRLRGQKPVLKLKGGATLKLKSDAEAVARPSRAPTIEDTEPPLFLDFLEEQDDKEFDTAEGEAFSTDESDFDTTSIKDRYRATEGGSVKDRYFDSVSRARRTEPKLEQPISNAERIRRLELRQFRVQTPAEIEAKRQEDLKQFQVGSDKILTPVSNVRSQPITRDLSRGADTNREVFGIPEVPRPPTEQELFIDAQRQSPRFDRTAEAQRQREIALQGFPTIPFEFADPSESELSAPSGVSSRSKKGFPVPSSSSSSGGSSGGQGGAGAIGGQYIGTQPGFIAEGRSAGSNRVAVPRRSDRQAQAEIDRRARRRMLRAQAERLDAERKAEERRQKAEREIREGKALPRDYPDLYESSGIESVEGYNPSQLGTSDTSYLSTDDMSELGSRAVQRADIRRTIKKEQREQREERQQATTSLLDNVFTKALKTDRYRNRAPRGTAKEKLSPELRDEVAQLEERIKEIKKLLVKEGIGRPDVAKAGTKKLQLGIFQRLGELGLIGEQRTKLLLDELFSKSARLTQLRTKKFKKK